MIDSVYPALPDVGSVVASGRGYVQGGAGMRALIASAEVDKLL